MVYTPPPTPHLAPVPLPLIPLPAEIRDGYPTPPSTPLSNVPLFAMPDDAYSPTYGTLGLYNANTGQPLPYSPVPFPMGNNIDYSPTAMVAPANQVWHALQPHLGHSPGNAHPALGPTLPLLGTYGQHHYGQVGTPAAPPGAAVPFPAMAGNYSAPTWTASAFPMAMPPYGTIRPYHDEDDEEEEEEERARWKARKKARKGGSSRFYRGLRRDEHDPGGPSGSGTPYAYSVG
ncbi:uncharacterized protein EI90DRAFT_3017242 [Cantharellus anzutake]|uniref:uncharacterized protein n=1 Tax=Cantharellus anzutake TaxID=1750568 RepID=UPI0019081901|nr:uncharacterized protein EI90DRAFT_3017242 [Cantharellus anzutake]KAF8329473.1 hypothetical protein EI90DRAFT_3017242 [Cantharellus anzutake]